MWLGQGAFGGFLADIVMGSVWRKGKELMQAKDGGN